VSESQQEERIIIQHTEYPESHPGRNSLTFQEMEEGFDDWAGWLNSIGHMFEDSSEIHGFEPEVNQMIESTVIEERG
jgi:hypothetical protein